MCSLTESECGFVFILPFYSFTFLVNCLLKPFSILANHSIFRHVGGLFTGSSDGKYPGLAGLRESGELLDLVKRAKGVKKDLVSSSVEIFQ